MNVLKQKRKRKKNDKQKRENGDRFSEFSEEFSKVYREERKIFLSPWQDLALLDQLSWGGPY